MRLAHDNGGRSPAAEADRLDGLSLPAWTYRSQRFFDLEREAVFRPSWQLVCHVNDVPAAGDYHRFDFLGESIVTVRGRDGAVASFHNVCRHRAARLLDGDRGNCGGRITCPYHAWTYGLDGKLIGVPRRASFGEVDWAAHHLASVEQEIYLGFVFVRLADDGGLSVAEMMAPYTDQLAPYRFEELVPQGRVTLRPREVNWKNVADNYGDGLHINIAHPGLTRLFGKSYGLEAMPHADKMWGDLQDAPSRNWSERLYQKLLPEVPHLPADRQRHWMYVKLWPNVAFDIYPDQVDFMQFVPVSPTETVIREIAYVLPGDERREMRAARYLNWRINRQVNAEDTDLIARVQAGMGSSSYTTGPLSDDEVCLRSFARRMRTAIPEACLEREPA
ncbi:aromatic ring-hydroxylating dioxygenase subunit alpha [Sphingoaurantiacus capsulatus]|uniref:Aromatic ring-hydroxylating dioxygenase subunit alpha n=1 Tax=Sphingoaurantiacus capsulatus TaxID=1771310 RepID=A0ABV7XDW7_9SPHN